MKQNEYFYTFILNYTLYDAGAPSYDRSIKIKILIKKLACQQVQRILLQNTSWFDTVDINLKVHSFNLINSS